MVKIKKINIFVVAIMIVSIFTVAMRFIEFNQTSNKEVIAQAVDYDNFKVQGRDNNTGDYIIAAINVKDFGAKGDGVADDTNAIKTALRSVNRNMGETVVYFPAGKYRVTSGGIMVYSNTTLRGQWNDPSKNTNKAQTLIIADYNPTGIAPNEAGDSLFNMQGNSAVIDFCIYYPRQNIDDIKAYNYTFWVANHVVTIKNITMYNSYLGINAGNKYGGSAHFVKNIYGTVLKEGIYFDWNYEISSVSNINFSSKYWKDYDKAIDENKIKAYTSTNCNAIRLGKVDDVFVYNLNAKVDEFKNGVSMYYNEEIPNPPKIAYGLLTKLNGASVYKGDKAEPNPPHIYEVDKIKSVDEFSYSFANDRYPSKEQVFLVTSDQFGAKGDGLTNDTNSIKKAIKSAEDNGGGTVFFPKGDYLINEQIIVGENVELRGVWDSEHPQSPSRFIVDYGENKPEDSVFVLNSYSGIHGFTVRFKNHNYNNFKPYAYIIKGNGKACWVEYLTVINGYNGVNFADAKCDNFLVKGMWGTLINNGINVGGGSSNGVMEFNMFTFGTWYEDCGRGDGKKIENYCYANSVGYKLGDCSNIVMFSPGIFGLKTGIMMGYSGKPNNVLVFRALLDNPFGTESLEINDGNNITFVGLSTGNHPTESCDGKFIRVGELNGKVRIFGQNSWGGAENFLNNKDVEIYDELSSETDVIKYSFNTEPEVYVDKTEDATNNKCGGCIKKPTNATLVMGIALLLVGVFIKRKF